MSTRCRIQIKDEDGEVYRIYRHSDGYPEGVIADLYIFKKNYHRSPFPDSEYFLANFIFYAKLLTWMGYVGKGYPPTHRPWEYTYGVCSPACEHEDLEYSYTLQGENVVIEEWRRGRWVKIFEGTLEDAYEKFCKNTEYADGCHITQFVFDYDKLLTALQ